MRKISIPSNLFLLFLLVLLIIPPGCERILGYLKSRMDEDFKRRSEKRYEKISGYPKTAVSSYGEDVGT
ncbi:MAG: hypothetical protein QMD66_07490, partial [Actinomycetota bacterium]|nr:hypothetical protein [Actinomycetota bacterium]